MALLTRRVLQRANVSVVGASARPAVRERAQVASGESDERLGAGRDEEDLVRLVLPLDDDDGSTIKFERVWAEPVGEDTYRVRNVPAFAYHVNNNDIVRAMRGGDVLRCEGVVERSGHQTYRVLIPPNCGGGA